MTTLTRRSLIQGVSAAALTGGAATITGCGQSDGGQPESRRVGDGELPTFAEPATVKPDLVSEHTGGTHGYLSYPADPKPAAEPPLSGGKITALTYTFDPVAPAMVENPLWQKVNQGLGAELDITYAPSADYTQRFATTIAGGDLPDLVTIYGSVQQLPALLKSQFTDLSEHLAGDAIADYPNLAGLATESWRETVIDGSIWGVPIARPPIGGAMFVRKDVLDKQGLAVQPKDFAEFKELLIALTDERNSRWACGDPAGVLGLITSMLGIPSMWLEEGGKFTANIETEPYTKALADARGLVEAGVFHPDGLTATNNQRNDWFTAGRTPLVIGGFVGYSKYEMWGAEVPGFELATMLPVGYDGSTKPVHNRGTVMQAMTVIKKSELDRVKELLKSLDWLATPFGSSEYLTRKFGIEGETYALEGTDPILNSRGQNLKLVPFGYISDSPLVIYDPGQRRIAEARFAYQEKALAMTGPDPTIGLYSEAEATKNAQIGKALEDHRREILIGRKPLASWADAVSAWRKGGGDEIRSDYETAFAAK
ncbi:extracellular solute-binding protein [Microlunatus sp. GCM10028923]|uniref:extracellular solute-binding protein n=1 Tax=Microlunatus sp. GCM10028923 TaxID=3273400 RepID=UPI003611A57E